MLIVLVAHHRDRSVGHGAVALFEHGEQHLFLLLHMVVQLFAEHREKIAQTTRAGGVGAMHLLHAVGQTRQFFQLLAVTGVIAGKDMGDQRRSRLLVPVGVLARLPADFGQALGQLLGIQAAHAGGVAQALIAAAAEIQTMIAEQTRGAGNLAGQLAQGLIDKWGGHAAILGSKDLPTILGSTTRRSLMTIKGVGAGCV